MPFDPFGGAAVPPVKPRKRKLIPGRPTVPSGVVGTPWDPAGAAPGAAAPPPGFDYAGAIANDPVLGQIRDSISAAGISDAASRDAALRRAFIQFGGNPDFGALGFNPLQAQVLFDDPTRALAAQNTQAGLSTTARLERGRLDDVQGLRSTLASRGMSRSGETGYQLGRQQQAFTTASYDATQKLVDYMGGVQAAYAESERQRQAQLAAATQEAAGRQATYPWNQPTPEVTPSVPPPAAAPPMPRMTPAPKRTKKRPRLGMGW